MSSHISRLLFVPAAVLLLSACQPPVALMPPPSVFVKNEQTLFGANANLDKSNEIQVFYATNRVPRGPPEARNFTNSSGTDLYVGVARMSIGGPEVTWEELFEQSTTTSDARRPPILLKSLDEKAVLPAGASLEEPGEEAMAFFRLIDEALAKSADPNLTIYVHGANTRPERAAGQAAQYRHFTGRNSVVLSYMWPASPNFVRFSHDMNAARDAAPLLAGLVRQLAAHTRAQHINLIGYSSGASVVSPALAGLAAPTTRQDQSVLRLGEVYYPAPDADFRSFVRDLRTYRGLAQRVTVTVNMNDSVLALSRFHQRASRVGRPDPTELSESNSLWLIESSRSMDFDLISARAEDLPGMSQRSHVFWYDHPWVSSDVLFKMLFHLPPAQRGLQEDVTSNDLSFWAFPADYSERMNAAVEELIRRRREQGGSETSPETSPETSDTP